MNESWRQKYELRWRCFADFSCGGAVFVNFFCGVAVFRTPHVHLPEKFETGGFTLKTHKMFSVHTTLEEFENRSFHLKTHQMFSVHTTLEEFENGGFTLKTHKMFSVYTTPEKFKTQSPVILDLCLTKTWLDWSPDYRDAIALEKLRF